MGKPIHTVQKLRGGYYTPSYVSDWLARWAVRSGDDRVLEPSCGDGAFVRSAAAEIYRSKNLLHSTGQIKAIELTPNEAEKARVGAPHFTEVLNGDFFKWFVANKAESFDAVLGNPPFIRYQNFPEPSRTLAMQAMMQLGLAPNRLTNIWVPFVVASVSLLKEGGRLAMVLPAELLQVSYAAQLRQYLVDSFQRLTIYTCNEIFFEGAEQEVVLLAAEGKQKLRNLKNKCQVSVVETAKISELLKINPKAKRPKSELKTVQHDNEKWLKYFLDTKEIELMRELRNNEAICTMDTHASIDVGVVTGRNEFFVIDQSQVKTYGLEDFVMPVVGRSAQLPGAVHSMDDHQQLGVAGSKVFLLNIRDEQLPAKVKRLISEGEQLGYHTGFKCSIRTPWYKVPSIWKPDCFFFRQIYDFPRIVVNKANATSTDTIHRMKCVGEASVDKIAANLYTHLTAASAEIEGRSYGGGVLELEPTEAERLLVPKHLNGAIPIADADRLVRKGLLSQILEANDKLVLREAGLTVRECGTLKAIWIKMRDRRAKRKRA